MNDKSRTELAPCTGVCQLAPTTQLCSGCRRTLAKIAGWSTYSAEQKQTVLQQLPNRQKIPPST
ncbi:MAG: DUF1289 domain-containing protein [Gammaproteobacteria bacterium]|nr:DUF1289 domain-containing protein [Gammaproteobacteria bacterium]